MGGMSRSMDQMHEVGTEMPDPLLYNVTAQSAAVCSFYDCRYVGIYILFFVELIRCTRTFPLILKIFSYFYEIVLKLKE